MACIQADGTLTSWALAMLAALQSPRGVQELAGGLGLPVFRVRASLRELSQADLVESVDGGFGLTQHGREVVADG